MLTAPEIETQVQYKQTDIVGRVFPMIRIKDYSLQKREIAYFELNCEEMLPEIYLHIITAQSSLVRDNVPVDGDRVNIYFRQDIEVFRPIKGDYLIYDVKTNDELKDQEYYDIKIWAKLWIPNLNSQLINFDYTGYAEDALKDVAKRLQLGYVHTPNTKTKYKQTWYCYSNPLQYISDVTSHMWLAKDSFFDSWIDPYLNLTVVNVNDMLGRTLADDSGMDITKFMNVIGTISQDGKYISNDEQPLMNGNEAVSAMPKIFTNFWSFEKSRMYVNKYRYVNNSTAITKRYGTMARSNTYINNMGLGQANQDSAETVDIGVWYNQEKLDAGYVIANGPTEHSHTYNIPDNGSWLDQNAKQNYQEIYPLRSDDDTVDANSDNEMSSGNVFKMYGLAPKHNEINLAELDKQYVIINCTGVNLGVARGEKVPVILLDNKISALLNRTVMTQDYSALLDRKCCGWFYVKSIKYIYTPNDPRDLRDAWQTELTLTRREWMSPEATSTADEAGDKQTISNNTSQGSSIESQVQPTTNVSADPDTDTNVKADTVTDDIISSIGEEIVNNFENIVNNISSSYVSGASNLISSATDDLSDMTNLLSEINNLTGSAGNKLDTEIIKAQALNSSITDNISKIKSLI